MAALVTELGVDDRRTSRLLLTGAAVTIVLQPLRRRLSRHWPGWLVSVALLVGAVGLSTTLTFLSLVFWTWILGPLGALLAVPMTLLARALLIEADPAHRWMMPMVTGRVPDERLRRGAAGRRG